MPEKKPVLWEPMREMMDLEDTFNRFFMRPRWFRRALAGEGILSPDIDVFEKENKIIVKADIPGLEKNDIHISVEGDTLTIRGERKKEKEVKEGNYYCCERTYGAFSRSISLPVGIEKDNIKANYKNGTLSIELPKSKEMRAKEVAINVE